MRLIDAEKINLSGKFEKYDGKPLSADELKLLDAVEMYLKIAVPTAYDVDKVVKQLEKFREEAQQFHVSGMLTDIIEAVKAGGLNE